METLPENAILVSLDVVGLYPHIPHAEGLEAIRHALNKREDQEMPTSLIVDLAELVLKIQWKPLPTDTGDRIWH